MSHHEQEDNFSLKKLFVPLTTLKAIHIFAIVGFLVFGNMFFNGFVLDDKPFIINNPDIHSVNLIKLLGPNSFNDTFYRPISAIYFASLYSLFKTNVFFYHFFQLILHIINTVILYKLFNKFFNKYLSLFLSLIFLVHPMQIESVSYISGSGDLLFFLFGISALYLSIKKEISPKRISLIFILLFLSLLSKETGVFFIISVLMYRLFFNRGKVSLFVIGTTLVGFLYLIIRFNVIKIIPQGSKIIPITELSLSERLANIPAIFLYYLKTFFFPKDLIIAQHWVIREINFSSFYFPLMIIVLYLFLIGSLSIYILKKHKQIFPLFIHLQIIPLDMTVSDRWFYFPMAGLLGTIGAGLALVPLKNRQIKFLFVCFAIVSISALSLRTIVRNTNWVDAVTLYKHDLQIQESYILENGLGNRYVELGKYDQALIHYKKSAEMLPNEQTLYNIAIVYEKLGKKEKAKEYYSKALNEKHFFNIPQKHLPALYRNLVVLLLSNNEFEPAKKITEIALRDYPDSSTLWMWLAISKYKLGEQKEALVAAEKAKELSPNEKIDFVYKKILNKEPIDLK